jgi:hypothetical protein
MKNFWVGGCLPLLMVWPFNLSSPSLPPTVYGDVFDFAAGISCLMLMLLLYWCCSYNLHFMLLYVWFCWCHSYCTVNAAVIFSSYCNCTFFGLLLWCCS